MLEAYIVDQLLTHAPSLGTESGLEAGELPGWYHGWIRRGEVEQLLRQVTSKNTFLRMKGNMYVVFTESGQTVNRIGFWCFSSWTTWFFSFLDLSLFLIYMLRTKHMINLRTLL
jgi:hypothetical protein